MSAAAIAALASGAILLGLPSVASAHQADLAVSTPCADGDTWQAALTVSYPQEGEQWQAGAMSVDVTPAGMSASIAAPGQSKVFDPVTVDGAMSYTFSVSVTWANGAMWSGSITADKPLTCTGETTTTTTGGGETTTTVGGGDGATTTTTVGGGETTTTVGGGDGATTTTTVGGGETTTTVGGGGGETTTTVGSAETTTTTGGGGGATTTTTGGGGGETTTTTVPFRLPETGPGDVTASTAAIAALATICGAALLLVRRKSV